MAAVPTSSPRADAAASGRARGCGHMASAVDSGAADGDGLAIQATGLGEPAGGAGEVADLGHENVDPAVFRLHLLVDGVDRAAIAGATPSPPWSTCGRRAPATASSPSRAPGRPSVPPRPRRSRPRSSAGIKRRRRASRSAARRRRADGCCVAGGEIACGGRGALADLPFPSRTDQSQPAALGWSGGGGRVAPTEWLFRSQVRVSSPVRACRRRTSRRHSRRWPGRSPRRR